MHRRTIMLALVMAVGGSTLLTAQAGAKPDHNGPFAVGARIETFVDSTRPTPANGGAAGSPTRTLATLILYPAQGKPGGDDAAVANADTPADLARVLANRAPLLGAGRFPTVVYAHGLCGGEAYLAYPLAAAGFVVVAPSFPLTNKESGICAGSDAVNQPGDVSFLISKMQHLAGRDHNLQSIVDTKAVGVTGASLGAATALGVAANSCCRDPRIRAAVSIAGSEAPYPNGAYFTGKAVPLLVIHGNADPAAPYQGSVKVFADAPAPKFFVTLIGAAHIQFGAPWDSVVSHAQADFFDRYLKAQTAALGKLQADASVTGVANIEQTPR